MIQFCHGSERDLEDMKKAHQDEHFPGSVEDFYRPIYFEALDLTVTGVQKRFDQPGYEVYSKLESFLDQAANVLRI